MRQAVRESSKSEATLGALVGHPTRVKAYVILTERVASPAEIAQEIGSETAGHVSYHVKKLLEFDLVELVDEKPVRGAMEHFYRASKRPFASDISFAEMDPDERDALTRYTLQLHIADAARAVEAGTFDARDNRWLVRLPMNLDDEGFQELADLHSEMYERKLEVQAKAAERISTEGAEEIPVVDTSMFYETPPKRSR